MPATSSQIPFSVGNHAIVIGGGGASPFAATGNGNPGTNTSLAYNGGTITSNAGGGGGETQQSGLVDLAVALVVTTMPQVELVVLQILIVIQLDKVILVQP